MRLAAALLPLLLSASTSAVTSRDSDGAYVVSREEILEAMQESRGYDLTATANGPRLHAEVLLRLAREARERDPEGPPLFFDRAAWFEAYLERTRLTPETAPLFVRLARQHGQDMEVDYRPERVLQGVEGGAGPLLAANVLIWWPEAPGAPSSYSYEDTLSSPRLRVTNKRVIRYRLLDYGDMIVYDEIEGLQGRPTSGALAPLFDVVGEASVVESRMALSTDGLQVSRGRGRKAFFDVTTTVTVFPNGRALRGLPPNRPDLLALENRLKRKLTLTFAPFPPRGPGAKPESGAGVK